MTAGTGQAPEGGSAGAVEEWRHQVSALGGRNPLLWHRETATGSFTLTLAHPGGVAKLLSGHRTLLSELVRESGAFAQGRRRVGGVRAKSVELLREHGLQSCFVAVGIATWELRRAPVVPRAPVLLRGCTIVPTDARHADFVLELEDRVEFNPVLLEYLRAEAGIELDPRDITGLTAVGSGFDPRPAYRRLEERCSALPGFTIGPQLVLSTFPWAKLALVTELTAGVAAGAAGAELVGALATGEAGAPPPRAGEGPARSATHTVLEADLSQSRVLRALSAGRSVVVDALPGTGRTQTVVNALARTVTEGRAALVVAEPRAALESVAARLADLGCDDLALWLGETPAAAAATAAELVRAVDGYRDVVPPPDPDRTETAAVDAERLLQPWVEHEQHLHRRHEPWGVSLADAQDALTVLSRRAPAPHSRVRLDEETLHELTPARRAEVTAVLTSAAADGAWTRGADTDPWYGASLVDAEEADRAGELVRDLVGGRLTEVREAVAGLSRDAGLPSPLTLRQLVGHTDLMGRVRETLDVFRPEVYEVPLDEMVRAVATGVPAGQRPPGVSRARLRRQARALLRPGSPPEGWGDRLAEARRERAEWEELAGRAARPVTPHGWEDVVDQVEALHADLAWLGDRLGDGPSGRDLLTTHLDLLLERLLRLDARADRLPATVRAHAALADLRAGGLAPLVDDLAVRGVAPEQVGPVVDVVFWTSLLTHLSAGAPGSEARSELVQAAEQFVAVEDELQQRARQRLRYAVHRHLAQTLRRHPEQVQALRDVSRRGPHTLAEVLAAAPDVVRALRPIWLGSPLVVPAAVPTDQAVDLVVVAEAQSSPLAHAVPALSRAVTVLAVGDSAGPGPQAFQSLSEPADPHPTSAESPSVLEALTRVLPVTGLDTDYRSVDQRLTDPLGADRDPVVTGMPGVLPAARTALLVADGLDGVIARTVDLAVEHARTLPRLSLAVLTGDDALAEDVDRALRARISGAPDLHTSFREDALEGFHLGSAARAAGVVRDRVVLALAPAREVLARRDLVAAALVVGRRGTQVVTDAPADGWGEGEGAGLLRSVLQSARTDPSGRSPVPPVVADLADRLRQEGLVVDEGFGAGPHRIHLAVHDPHRPGRPLLAVDTDAEALPVPPGRDRLRVRPRQLRRLGWTPLFVRSTDVFRDPAQEVARVLAAVHAAAEERRR